MELWLLNVLPGTFVWRPITMSFEAPPTLLELSMKSLLRDEALAISVLQQLPSEFFPSLFKEAYKSRHMKILTAMVAVWPFACLPVGAMMKVPDRMILQAVLDGVDIMLTDKAHFRYSQGILQWSHWVTGIEREESHRIWSVVVWRFEWFSTLKLVKVEGSIYNLSNNIINLQKYRVPQCRCSHSSISLPCPLHQVIRLKVNSKWMERSSGSIQM